MASTVYETESCGPLYSTPGEFENGGFTLKTHKMFSVHTTRKNLKMQLSHDYRDVIVFGGNLRFKNVFRPHGNKKTAVSNSLGLKSVFS